MGGGKQKMKKQIISILLACVMVLTLFPAMAFADEVVAKIGEQEYTSLQEAVNSAKHGYTIHLQKDITLSERIDISAAGCNITIDLNGKTVSSTETCVNGSVFNVISGTVNIGNGKLIGIEGETGLAAPYKDECDVITVRSGAIANLYNLDISVDSANGACAYAFDGGKINVYSGTYTNSAEDNDQSGVKDMLLNQADKKAQAIFVYGGTFNGLDPAKGDNSGVPSTFLANGYSSTEQEGKYIVSAANAVASIGENKYCSLEDAIAAAGPGAEINLVGNITLSDTVTVGKSITIKGNADTTIYVPNTVAINAMANSAFIITADNVTFDGVNILLESFASDSIGYHGTAVNVKANNFSFVNGSILGQEYDCVKYNATNGFNTCVGILLQESKSGATITGNTIVGCEYPMQLTAFSGPVYFENNKVEHSIFFSCGCDDLTIDNVSKADSHCAPDVEAEVRIVLNGGGANDSFAYKLCKTGLPVYKTTVFGNYSEGVYIPYITLDTDTEKAYSTLKSAVDAVGDQGTIKLHGNILINNYQDFEKDTVIVDADKAFSIDLNGYDITGHFLRVMHIKKGNVTITGIGNVGMVGEVNQESSVIRLDGSEASPHLTIDKDVCIFAPKSYAITLFSTKETENYPEYLTVYGRVDERGTENAAHGIAAISTNGSYTNSGSTITIKDSAVISSVSNGAIYLPSGILNIEGGYISGAMTAVYFKSTKLNITGGNLVSTAETVAEGYVYNGNGYATSGSALIIDSCNYPNGLQNDNISITGGYFESKNGKDIVAFNTNGGTAVTKVVCGGVYSSVPAVELLAEGMKVYRRSTTPELYIVSATEPSHSSGMNTWTLEGDYYVESYVAPPTPYYPPAPVTPPTPVEDPVVKAEEDNVVVAPKAEEKDGEVKAEISEENLEEALALSEKNESESIVIAPKVEDAKKVEIALPTDSVKEVASNTAVTLVVETEEASISIPNETLGEIVEAAEDKEIVIKVEKLDEKDIPEELSKEVPEAEDKDLIVVNVTISSGEKVISTFGGKSLEVHVPVDTKKFEEGKTYAAYIISADGSIEKTIATIKNGKAVVVTTHFSTIVVTGEEKCIFEDVEKDTYYYDAVLWAVQNGITTGVDATHFDPNGIASRAQMVTFLWRAAGCPKPTTTECAFTDIEEGSYYYEAVLWAVEKGITGGTSATTFEPTTTVSRSQAVTFMARMCGVKDEDTGYTHPFTDVEEGTFYNNAVAWAYANKVTDGTSETTFSPINDCLRGQVVTYLYRYFGK